MNTLAKKRVLEYDVEVSCGNIFMCGYVGKMVPKGENDKEYQYGCPECGRMSMTLRKSINDKFDLSKKELGIK